MMFIKDFKEINKKHTNSAGGKGANLGELMKVGMPIPPGFVVLASLFENFLTVNDINIEIERLWDKINFEDIKSVEENSEILKDLILKSKMPKDIEKKIFVAFNKLNTKYVAVRSSATAEDSGIDSWAGQLETYLNTTKENLIENIKKCWASLYSPRALFYRERGKTQLKKISVAVIVQKMIQSEVSGVCFTANPVTRDRNQMVIEAVFGLGEMLVSGRTTPDSYIVNKQGLKILDIGINPQEKIIVKYKNENKVVNVLKSKRKKQKLSKNQIRELAKLCITIENNYKRPQDIEWTLKKNKFYIVQSRPITTLEQEAVDLPKFFHHCIKTIARPSTLQRDEIFCFTSNAITPADVVTLPLEGNNRAYYSESRAAKRIMVLSLQKVASKKQLQKHLLSYETLKKEAASVCKLIEKNPRDFQTIFKKYKDFLKRLAVFLYVGVAIDAVLYPKFKKIIEENYASQASQILDAVATPKGLHDYQKLRLELCRLKTPRLSAKETAAQVQKIARSYAHVNEYSFVEPLLTKDSLLNELNQLTVEVAKTEIRDIKKSVDDSNQSGAFLKRVLPEPLLTQAFLIKEYALLRTDRIDQLKKVQSRLRTVYEELAKAIAKQDSNSWTKEHVVNLLDVEIDRFITSNIVPPFDEIKKRLSQTYLYYYTNHKATVLTDQKIVRKAQNIIIQPADKSAGSLISPGIVAFPGVTIGRVVRVASKEDLTKVRDGDIMVAHITMPDYTATMKKAGGFITAEGGVTSHAAIVARELGKPCIVGAGNCMQTLRDGDYILLDAGNQIVRYAKKH